MKFTSRLVRIVLVVSLLSLAATAMGATGVIHITVQPGGGTVCLDTICKENQGTADGVSSTTFENVEAGHYHMLNVYGTPGFEPYLKQIFLDPSGTALSRNIQLVPLPLLEREIGTLRVFITPDGGKACIDRMCEVSAGDRTGSWTVQFTDIPAKTYHNFSVINPGYETFTAEIRLLPGETKSMTISLAPLPPDSITPPEPTPLPTPEPQPTPTADLPGAITLIATGLCGVVLVLKRRRQ